MSTEAVAKKLVEMIRSGQMGEAVEELYADHVVSIEPEGYGGGPERIEGTAGKLQKASQFNEMVEEMHGMEISDPIVADAFFSVMMKMDVTYKGMGRAQMEEICVYEVRDGKVVMEKFFFTPQQG